MFGFLAAVGLAIGIAALLAFMPSGKSDPAAPPADLPNGEDGPALRFLSLSAAAGPSRARPDRDRRDQPDPSLAQADARTRRDLDPDAQDARRLMSIHLPGLIDRYGRVPASLSRREGRGRKTVDERLVEGLAAGRARFAKSPKSSRGPT